MGWLNFFARKRLQRNNEKTNNSNTATDTPEAGATKGSTYNIQFAEAGSPSVIVGADSAESMNSMEQTSLLQSPMDTEDEELKKQTRFVGGLTSSRNISI